MKNLLMAIAMVFGASQAMAKDTREDRTSATAWACNMAFNGEAVGVKLVIGFYNYTGYGKLNCISASNERVSLPIVVKMKAAPISPTVSLSKMELFGQAANISLLNTYPEALLGKYTVVQGSAALVGGVGAMTAVHSELPSVTVNVSLQLVKGFGVNLGVNRMSVELDESRL